MKAKNEVLRRLYLLIDDWLRKNDTTSITASYQNCEQNFANITINYTATETVL